MALRVLESIFKFMKTIIKPAEREEAVYFSDISGKSFGEFAAPVELKLSFNYGSKHDGTEVNIDLDDEEVRPFLELLKKSVSEDFKQKMKKNLEKIENNYESSMQMRDWDYCDRMSDSIWFWREFLGLKDDY